MRGKQWLNYFQWNLTLCKYSFFQITLKVFLILCILFNSFSGFKNYFHFPKSFSLDKMYNVSESSHEKQEFQDQSPCLMFFYELPAIHFLQVLHVDICSKLRYGFINLSIDYCHLFSGKLSSLFYFVLVVSLFHKYTYFICLPYKIILKWDVWNAPNNYWIDTCFSITIAVFSSFQEVILD